MEREFIYPLLESYTGIHLGAPEKLLINHCILEKRLVAIEEIYLEVGIMFTRMGYESSNLDFINKRHKELSEGYLNMAKTRSKINL